MTTEVIRLCWIAAQIVALIRAARSHLHAWKLYLVCAILIAPLYFPETRHWWQMAWPWLLIVLATRTAAIVEALHWQLASRPDWTRMTGGAFLVAYAIAAMLWWIHGAEGEAYQVVVEFRRYPQIWAAAALLISQGMLLSLSEWKGTPEDRYAVALTALASNHATVSVLYLSTHLDADAWVIVNRMSTVWDTVCYLAISACLPVRRPSPPSRRVGVAVQPALLRGGQFGWEASCAEIAPTPGDIRRSLQRQRQ